MLTILILQRTTNKNLKGMPYCFNLFILTNEWFDSGSWVALSFPGLEQNLVAFQCPFLTEGLWDLEAGHLAFWLTNRDPKSSLNLV